MTTQPTDERVEKVAEQLHEWYLEATNQDGAKYNHEAVVPYGDLPEGSKLLDRYIASKIITTLLADCEARVKGEVRQKLREIKLLDYYCKCDDVGHVIAMPRAEYDTLITHLESRLLV